MTLKTFKANGFTLIELMVGVAIISISIALSSTNINDMIGKSRSEVGSETIMSLLKLARSEAAMRGGFVTVCASANGESCSGDSSGWKDGLLVFEDNNADGDVDLGDTPIKRINWDGVYAGKYGSDFLVYNDLGISSDGADTFVFCVSDDPTRAIAINVNAIGRPTKAFDNDDDGVPNDYSGENITCP